MHARGIEKERRVRKRTVMNNHRKVAPHGSFATMPARALTGGIQVQLALEDVINDWLAQVIHHVPVAMLKGQSVRGGQRKKKEEKSMNQVTLKPDRHTFLLVFLC